jgi:hypothetical protein
VFVDADDNAVTQYIHEVVIEPELALWENIDYSGTAVSSTLAEPRDYVRRDPLLLFKRPTDNRWVIGSEMALAAGGESDPQGAGTSARFSCVLTVQPNSRIVEVHTKGEPQHAIASTDFGALAADRDVGEYDYKSTKMLVTLTLRDNRYCEGRWPAKGDSDSTSIDAQRGMVVFAEGEYRQDYLALDTVVDVDDDGTLVTNTAAGYFQNDSDKLKSYARLIYEWYVTTRYAITLTTYRIQSGMFIGDYIEDVGDTAQGHTITANSVITEMTIQCPRSPADDKAEVKQTFQTGFGQLDVLGLMPRDPRRDSAVRPAPARRGFAR